MKAYLIPVSVALSLGYVAGFATDGLIAKAAVNRTVGDVENVTLDDASQLALEAIMDTQVCSKQNEKFGLAGANSCRSADHAKTVRFTWRRGVAAPLDENGNPTGPPVPYRKVDASAAMSYAVTMTFGPPQ